MTTEGFGYMTPGAYTADLGPNSRPYLHLIVYSLITLWTLYGCNGSAATLGVFNNSTAERMFEQIPLSMGLGYLLYRALDAKLRSGTTESSASDWTLALGFVAGGALAGYMLMNYFSAFIKDADDKAQIRKNTMYEIANQTLVFTAIFMFIAQWKTPKLRRKHNFKSKPPVMDSQSWNGDGHFRKKCNIGIGVLVVLAILICDGVCIGKTAFGDDTWDSPTAEDNPVYQMIARAVKALALFIIAAMAFRFEMKLPDKNDGREGNTGNTGGIVQGGDAGVSVRSRSVTAGGAQNAMIDALSRGEPAYGYEI